MSGSTKQAPQVPKEAASAEEAQSTVDDLAKKGIPSHRAPADMENEVASRGERIFGSEKGQVFSFLRLVGSDCKHTMHPGLPDGYKPTHTVVIISRDSETGGIQGMGLPCAPPWSTMLSWDTYRAMSERGYRYVMPTGLFD